MTMMLDPEATLRNYLQQPEEISIGPGSNLGIFLLNLWAVWRSYPLSWLIQVRCSPYFALALAQFVQRYYCIWYDAFENTSASFFIVQCPYTTYSVLQTTSYAELLILAPPFVAEDDALGPRSIPRFTISVCRYRAEATSIQHIWRSCGILWDLGQATPRAIIISRCKIQNTPTSLGLCSNCCEVAVESKTNLFDMEYLQIL